MQTTDQKFLIIGAGFVGLAFCRALKQASLPYDCVESDDDLGGNWRHGVYPHVHIISSKKTTEYSDYPMPADYPPFPSAGQVLAYLNDYAEHFALRKHIQFGQTVTLVRPILYAGDQKWEVTLAGGERRVYKGVLVCNGHHWNPKMPSYPGEFTGELMHSKQYKGPDKLLGKRVLVIGGGNSACDVAVDAARYAQSAHISQRRGYWVLPKMLMGRPTVEFIRPWIPVAVQRLLIASALRLTIGKYTDYGLQQPDHRIFEAHPTLNNELLYYLAHGRITPHPDIRRWDGNTVEFVDGKRAEFDLIVAATGYHVSFPFLAKGLVEVKDAIPQLPGDTFHPDFKHLYVIGSGQPRYGVGPLATAGAAAIAYAIQLQDQLTRPLGRVMLEVGLGPNKSHLHNPTEVLAKAKKAPGQLRILAWLERNWLVKRSKWVAPQPDAYIEAEAVMERYW